MGERESVLLGFDVGTSAVKAAAFELDGTIAGVASRPVELDTPADGICEVDPRDYWSGLAGCCADLAEAGVDLGRVGGLAVAAHAETLLVVDAHLRPVRPAIVWLDTRSQREAGELARRFGADELAARSGQPQVIPMWPATKMLWLRRHEPEVVAAARWWLQPLDYLQARLTGRVASDASEYSSSLLLDVHSRGWWRPMLDELGVDESALPELVPAGAPLGPLRGEAAAELGLRPGTTVVAGGFDQACTAVGAGNVRDHVASVSTGSSLACHATVAAPPRDDRTVPCHVHVVPGKWFLCAHNPAGGAVLAWVRERFAPGRSFAQLDALAEPIAPGAEELVLLPYLSGSVTPELDPSARGVLFGLSPRHGLPQLARAALEGVAFALADLLDAARRVGVEPGELRSVGGGARSALWTQIKADVTGLPLHVPAAADHAGALGAAVLAGVGAGVFASVEAGADALVRIARTVEPRADARVAYERPRAVYRELYPRLRDLFPREEDG